MSSIFFQAEDGIRDIGVTGVQTCALPISMPTSPISHSSSSRRARSRRSHSRYWWGARPTVSLNARARSEERRVGKEHKFRGTPNHLKNNVRRIVGHDVREVKSRNIKSPVA